jgi:hypothetical protein
VIGIDLTDALRLGIGITLVAEATLLVRRRPALGIWILAIASVLSSLGITVPVNVRSVSIYLLDGVVLVLFAATVTTVATQRRLSPFGFGLGLIVAIGAARAVSGTELQGIVNASRGIIYFLVALAFAEVCVGPDGWPVLERAWRMLAAGLVVWAAWFVMRNGLGTYAATGERGLSAPQALIVGQAAVISLASGARRHLLFLGACGLALLATQQRTALAATALGVLVVTLRAGRLSSARATRVVRFSVAAGLVLTLALLMVGPGGLRESVSTAAASASTTSGTLGWRIDGWTELLDDYAQRSTGERLIGQPAGAGFGRYLDGNLVTVSPHNMYLTILLVTGAVGLVVFLIIVVLALFHTRAGPLALHALVWTALAFSIGYQLEPEQGLVLGAALAVVGSTARSVPAGVTSPP